MSRELRGRRDATEGAELDAAPALEAAPFADALEHLLAELERVDLLVRVQVTRMRAALGKGDPFAGLYISQEELERLLARPVGAEPWFNAPPAAAPASLAAALAAMRARIDRRLAATPRPPRLRELTRRFGLDPVEQDLLLIALAPELDLRFERLYAWLQDDVSRRRPSVDLALQLLFEAPRARLDARGRLLPGAPLLHRRLLIGADDPARPDGSGLARTLRVAPSVVRHLLGQDELGPEWAEILSLSPEGRRLDELLLPPETREGLQRLAAGVVAAPLFLAIGGPPGAGRRSTARALARGFGRRLLEIDVEALLRSQEDARGRIMEALREAALRGAVPCWVGLERLPASPALGSALVLESLRVCPFAVGTQERGWEAPALGPLVVEIALPRHDLGARRELWRRALGASAPGESALDELAASYRMGGDRVDLAVSSAMGVARWRGGEQRSLTREDLIQGVRRRTETPTQGLAQRRPVAQGWEDLVLPARAARQLRELAARVEHRATVEGRWGLGRRSARGRGVHALFAGPPGTGKTMAAGIIADEIGVDLLQVDLSQVVSKYIGETEKHLARVFDTAEAGGAVLFFDEADALFGRRTAVQDAHDRYANLQVSYLLQRMEEYEGLCVLATNLRTNLDDAFLRRLTAIVEFPIPDEAARTALWTRALGGDLPLAPELRPSRLARFQLSGGNITNVVTAAAYGAAADGGELRMPHLLRAVADELRKVGRPVLREDFGEWYELLDRDG